MREEFSIPEPERVRSCHRLQIFKRDGRVQMFCSKSGYSREEEFYLYDQIVGTGSNGKTKYNPLGYFCRLAQTRMQGENKYFLENNCKDLYEQIMESVSMKMEVFEWEPVRNGVTHSLPTIADLEAKGMTHCPYQTQLPFNVESFEKNVRKFEQVLGHIKCRLLFL